MDIKELEHIITLVKQSDVTEFELQKQGVTLKLTRKTAADVPVVMQPVYAVQPAIGQPQQMPAGDTKGPKKEEIADHLTKVESPIVGTFYRKPSPDAEPFVQQGDMVKKGDTLCIIEAMKLMNEIEAPCSGRVEKVMSSDGHVVEFGEVLFLINAQA